jgi:hypothetical protein
MVSHGVPPGKVKVTVNLDAQLKKTAQIAAIERDLTLGELIEEGLRLVLGRKAPPREPGKSRKP